MKSVLVAITTTGKRKEIFDVIKYTRRSLDKIGVKPVFSVCADEISDIATKSLKDTVYFSLKPEEFDYTYHNLEAIRRGILKFKPDIVSVIADDFIVPAKKFGNLIKPLLSDYDVTFGCWGSDKIASTYPKFQYVSELFVNKIANAATKSSPVDYENMLKYSFDYKSDFSNMIQLFTGLFGFRSGCWDNVFNRMLEIFGSPKLGWALDIPLFLSSVDLGLKITNVTCDKVKEKNDPISGEKITRLTQIKDAFKYTNMFLSHTKQYDKLKKLSKIQSDMIKIVKDILIKSGA